MSKYQEIGADIGALVDTKQAAYGNSFGKSGDIMRALYPNGISHEKLDDALTVVRVIDKLFRIATARDALGESPWRDIAGYSLLSVARVEATKEEAIRNANAAPFPKGWQLAETDARCIHCGNTTWVNPDNECKECFGTSYEKWKQNDIDAADRRRRDQLKDFVTAEQIEKSWRTGEPVHLADGTEVEVSK